MLFKNNNVPKKSCDLNIFYHYHALLNTTHLRTFVFHLKTNIENEY